MEPLLLDNPNPQPQPNGVFQVQHDGESGVHARQGSSGGWHTEYLFRLEARALAAPDGRVTLSDRRLIVTRNGQRTEHDLDGEADFQRHLREQFGIVLD